MRDIVQSTAFLKGMKRMVRRGCDKRKMQEAVLALTNTGTHADIFE